MIVESSLSFDKQLFLFLLGNISLIIYQPKAVMVSNLWPFSLGLNTKYTTWPKLKSRTKRGFH